MIIMADVNSTQVNDIFVANSIYPDTKTILTASKGLQEIKDECVVVIDTNALLVPYLIGPNGLAQIRKTYQPLAQQKRLFIPGQVAREFARNRTAKIVELYQQISRRRISLQKGQYPLLEEIPEYGEALKFEPEIDALLIKYKAMLDKVLDVIQSWEWNDPVSKLYQEILGADSIYDPKFDNQKIAEELSYRYQHKIPPGYRDGAKEDEGIGDYLIWKTILELGKTQSKSVILVSGEQKSDWRIKSEGKPLYPRYELIDEYKRVSRGRSFCIVQFSDFLNLYGASDATVQEVREKELEVSQVFPLGVSIPSALIQILMVCNEVLRRNREYTEATKSVAEELGIREQSVTDKCTRKIGINTQAFKDLLQNKDRLIAHLIDWFPDYEDVIRRAIR